MWGIIVVLVLLLIVIGICFIVYTNVKNKLAQFSRMAWGTSSILEGLGRAEMEYTSTPKSVAAGTSIYLPQIMRDFPEFHYDEMKERAENVLFSYLRSVEESNSKRLVEGTEQLKEKLEMYIEMLKAKQIKVHYDRIKVHRTEINRYRKEKGRCSIIFQSAVEYVHYTEKDGKVIAGREDIKNQTKYNIEVIYIQDIELVGNTKDMALGINCPNCNAPVSGVGAKVCAYCDTPIVELNIRSWNFSDLEEVR